ncbi:MAG: protein kinase domain-containing protein, partial [Verrucomicrobiales bacterium]
ASGQESPAYEVPTVAEIQAAFPDLEIIDLIGQGGMGGVFKALQPRLSRHVALKILPNQLAEMPGFPQRFQREAQALAALNHPHIITIHDFGQSPSPDGGGYYFLLMEYIDGMNLRDLLRSRQLTQEEALIIVPPIC